MPRNSCTLRRRLCKLSPVTTPKFLLVGWDGVRDDVLRRLRPDALAGLADAGRWWTTQLPDCSIAPTVTAVGWSTVLTGVGPQSHQVLSNTDEHHLLHRYPDLLTRAYCSGKQLTTYAAASALIFGTNYGPGPILGPGVTKLTWLDRREYPRGFHDTDPIITDAAVDELATNDPDLSFVYLGETDKTAHAEGVGARYDAAILRQDERLARMLEAVRSRPTFDDEDWLIMVTTDHGHRDEGGHGDDSWQERQSFVVAGGLASPGSQDWADEASNVDIAPTALAHLGVPIDPRWTCDGRSLISP